MFLSKTLGWTKGDSTILMKSIMLFSIQLLPLNCFTELLHDYLRSSFLCVFKADLFHLPSLISFHFTPHTFTTNFIAVYFLTAAALILNYILCYDDDIFILWPAQVSCHCTHYFHHKRLITDFISLNFLLQPYISFQFISVLLLT